VFFLEDILSYANQLSDQRQVPDATGTGVIIAKWKKIGIGISNGIKKP